MAWGNDDGPADPYDIGPATLDATARKVREALADLVRISGSGNLRAQAKALRELASAGSALYFVLFDSPGDQNAEDAKDALINAYERGDRKLRITGHPQVHVPWGLVFDGDPDELPANSNELVTYGNFWGLKYAQSCTLSGYTQKQSKLVRDAGRSKLLSLLNHAEASVAYGNLSETLRESHKALMARPVGVAHDLTRCLELIAEAVSYDTVLNVFTHQSTGSLGLGDGESIDIVTFSRLIEKLSRQNGASPSYSLVMLNACDSAAGSADYSFTCATNRPGMCGVIGTESVVPRDFAATFSIRFLDLVLNKGRSVGESMDELRHDTALWPLSLVYGCYAQPEYRITF